MIKLELTEEDALLFRQFREHQDRYALMVKAGVFDTQNGHVILNFDKAGTLTEIRKDVLTYKRIPAIVVIKKV